MAEVRLHYDIDGDDFSTAGEASGALKKALRRMGVRTDLIRRCSICMYEGEINAVIHASGGTADVTVSPEKITIVIQDRGPGIPNVEDAMREGWSTATNKIRELGFGAGMGLPNMRSCADAFSIETVLGKGTRVTMVINA